MELALSAFALRFSTFSLQFIDRSFDYRRIGKKWFNNLPDLGGQSTKGLPKLAERFLIRVCLYAHILISIKIFAQNARKKWISSKKILGMTLGRTMGWSNNDPPRLYSLLRGAYGVGLASV
jgi:hypothetical protein